ncbi:MAG: hypothetical protein MHM6MM_000884 [Cercozoa sp. M6MM]
MKFEDFDDFETAALRIFAADPVKARYTVRHRHADAEVFAKVTDNTRVAQFVARTAEEALQLTRFSVLFARLCAAKQSLTAEAVAELREACMSS